MTDVPTAWPTLLVVDDEPVNVRILSQAFLADHRVLMATNGLDALRLCRERRPDLVLLDVEMPGVGGHEVCRRLKADPATGDIPVIFVTAQDDVRQETLGLAIGAVDFIAKPVNTAVVRARVRTHLELRRAARELVALNASLESRIAERTRDLEAAMQAATAASRAKTDFLSNISHEIRTPINGVIGMTYLALRADPAPRQRGYLEKIRDCGEHLLRVVNDVLDFSRIEAGRMELEDIAFELPGLMAGVSSQASCMAEMKGLALAIDLDPELVGPFRGDSLRIAQILLNFVGNAIKFSSAGTVRVRALRDPGRGPDGVRFEVQDEGIGMTPAQLGELFRAFQQADTSTTRRFGGSGLGLAISRRLATLMHGEVGATSEPGVGSTFWLALPLRRPDPAPAVEPDVVAPHALAGARVLVVEDNPINRQLAVGLLEMVGVVVETAVDGQVAVDRAAQASYDVILMDVQMPVMDGLAATRALRASPRTRATPIIAVTANAGDEDRRRCFAAGMDEVVTKPIEPASLHALLARVIGRQAAPAAVQPGAD